MPKMNLLLRLMVEMLNVASAEKETSMITSQIEAYAAIENHTVEQYWKIPAYQEITLYLRPHGNPHAAYNSLVASATSGWTHGGSEKDRWAVWNPAPGAALLSPNVKWAELSLWYSDTANEEETP